MKEIKPKFTNDDIVVCISEAHVYEVLRIDWIVKITFNQSGDPSYYYRVSDMKGSLYHAELPQECLTTVEEHNQIMIDKYILGGTE
jgi:hypothetical protein